MYKDVIEWQWLIFFKNLISKFIVTYFKNYRLVKNTKNTLNQDQHKPYLFLIIIKIHNS